MTLQPASAPLLQPATAPPEVNGAVNGAVHPDDPKSSPLPGPSRLPRRKKGWGLGMKILALGLVLFLLASGLAAYFFWPTSAVNPAHLVPYTVKRERLQMTIVERGTLEAVDNRDVVCRVKAKTSGAVSS